MNGEARAVALEISEAFDKRTGPFHILKGYGVPGRSFDFIQSFLTTRVMKIVLNGHSSIYFHINAGLSHGFILRPTLFILFSSTIS